MAAIPDGAQQLGRAEEAVGLGHQRLEHLELDEGQLDPLTVPGSYAGALGVPQFMPSQYRRYAVAANADRPRDLWGDWDDILASVANYLNEHGWTAGGPVLAETRLEPDPSFQIEPHNLELSQTVESLAAHGVQVEMSVPADTAVVLISADILHDKMDANM